MEQKNNLFPSSRVGAAPSVTADIESDRAIQQVQAQVVVAKKFPRKEVEIKKRVLEICKSVELARVAEYEYPRGKDADTGKPNMVNGISIRLAEVLAQAWGNLDVATVVLSKTKTESVIMTHAWDLETNTNQSTTFTVPHWRDTKGGGYAITDERDIYELTANFASRRRRACILAQLPPELKEAARVACRTALAQNLKNQPVKARASEIIAAFATVKVTLKMIEQKLGHPLSALKDEESLELERIYNSLRDGMAKPEDFFEGAAAPSAAEKLNQRFSSPSTEQAAPPKVTRATKPKVEAQAQVESFADAPGGSAPLSLFANAKKDPTRLRTVEELEDLIFKLIEELGLTIEGVNSVAIAQIGKPVADMNLPQLEKFLGLLEQEKAGRK